MSQKLGALNFPTLDAYTIRGQDLELFQTYMKEASRQSIATIRSSGVLIGGDIVHVAGLSFKVNKSLFLFANGEVALIDELPFTLEDADITHPRIDRIEIKFKSIDGTVVKNNRNEDRTLDRTHQAEVVILKGVPAAVPVVPVKTVGNISIAAIQIDAEQVELTTEEVDQTMDTYFDQSSFVIGASEAKIRYHRDHLRFEISTDGGLTWDEVVSRNAIESLSNKTLVAPKLDIATFDEVATPANPPAGKYKAYFKNNGIMYMLKPTGEEIAIGSNVNSTDPFAFVKADYNTPCLVKTGALTISLKAGTRVMVDGALKTFLADTPVTMPTLVTGSDFAVYVCHDNAVVASNNFTAPDGYTTANSRKIGGFHYGAVSPTETVAGGAFATVGNGMKWTQTDVNNIRGINQFSIWDLKFRPACTDPRGMVLVAGRFWVDIYFCSTNPETNGTSKYGSDVASGTVLPKIPTMFGGNGTTAYTALNWWNANEIAKAFGKRLMKYEEFSVAAFGVTENQSLGGAATTIASTTRQAGYTSKWGLEQATGHHYTWGSDSSYRHDGTLGDAWNDQNGGRGQLYLKNSLGLVYVLLGGYRDHAAYSGSRASSWNACPWGSSWYIGLRAACDHLQLG